MVPHSPSLALQLFDVCIHGTQIAEVVVTPDSIEDALARQRNRAVIFEVDEQLVLLGGQVDRLVLHHDLTAQLIDRQLAKLFERCTGAAFSFEQCAHAGRPARSAKTGLIT